MSGRYSCDETFDIGPFRFECSGHLYDEEDRSHIAKKHHGGLITHIAQVRPCVGDVEVRWWTEAAEADR